tara:strand:- start:865 stop:1518 length:654 start_codon:yes stop_codon:yes gene_type:complete
MITKDLEVISVFGARGGGKTTLVMELLAQGQRQRVIVYDLKDEYRFKKIRGKAALWKFLKQNWYRDFKISYVPDARETPEHVKELSDICFAIAKGQKADESKGKGKNITILVEEMSVTAPNQRYPAGMGGFPYVVNVAREWGVEVIGVSQRPAQANPDFRGNSTLNYYFHLSDRNDVQAVKAKLGSQAEDLKTLERGDYIKFHSGMITRGKTKPRRR